jgi:L-threonylcarbamoyladenylate synthase
MPTETVYGLAARIDSADGISAIFKIKERPFFDPLIVHVSNFSQISSVVSHWPEIAQIMANNFWPGPLTFVLPKNPMLNPLITSGLETVAIRMPRHEKALALIEAEGVPLAAPSANKFGRTSPTTVAHVIAEFGDSVEIIDGGPCQVGVESTVLSISANEGGKHTLTILRPGAVTANQIDQVLKLTSLSYEWKALDEGKISSPGALKHHYMPDVPLIYIKTKGLSRESIFEQIKKRSVQIPEMVDGIQVRLPRLTGLARSPVAKVLRLSNQPELAARELYAQLRNMAQENPDMILFFETDLHLGEAWQAVIDRLTKAASLIV